MINLQKKNLSCSEEVSTFDKGRFEIANIAGFKFGRAIIQPGWRWSDSSKPHNKTESCQKHHIGYMIIGIIEGIMDNGDKFKLEAGDIFEIPKGHDAWVVGDTSAVYLEILSSPSY